MSTAAVIVVIVGLLVLLFTWALCRIAADADRRMEEQDDQ